MDSILTVEEAKRLGRPIGKVDANKIQAFINEIEQTIVRKRLGDNLYLDILAEVNTKPVEPTDNEETALNENGEPIVPTERLYDILLNGGSYTDKKERTRFITGLKVAEAYFVYAQNVRAGDFESTRYGMVKKDDEYSTGISSKERDMAANSATEIGNAYLEEVLTYCYDKEFLKPKDSGVGMNTTSGCVIRKVRV